MPRQVARVHVPPVPVPVVVLRRPIGRVVVQEPALGLAGFADRIMQRRRRAVLGADEGTDVMSKLVEGLVHDRPQILGRLRETGHLLLRRPLVLRVEGGVAFAGIFREGVEVKSPLMGVFRRLSRQRLRHAPTSNLH